MSEEIVYINNMSSPRDILLVSQALEHLGLRVKEIEIGAAAYINPDDIDHAQVTEALEGMGFGVIDPEAKIYSDRVRSLVSEHIDSILRKPSTQTFQESLENKLRHDFSYIDQQFQSITGQPLVNFYKRMKIERVKILLNNTALSLEEIAHKLDFKDTKDLSRIFKEVTGQTVMAFAGPERKSADAFLRKAV